MEQLDDNLLHRWFVGLASDDAVWDATTFTKNRERLHHQLVTPVLSDEHFSIDGTLIEAWGGHNSFKRKSDTDGDGANFHSTTRENNTPASTTDPDSRLYRKSEGKESKLCYMGHATRENRNGLAVAGLVTQASGTRGSGEDAGEERLATDPYHGRRGQGL